ncbi:hypothetical protein TrVE_jg11385 [Triparma verrucosa]|uniref:Uncharacterized protein n=1 Tax=Triparma verrucosa TaxID=1606542 RepID=A0A9W7EMW5_9STRA|nr:hypothetical protein TrVE_jg11385 [Triparma verrucosa]
MLRLRIRLTLCLLAFVLQSSAFVPIAPQQQIRSPTQMSMIFGPKQALAIEKRKDPKKFESTINGLMKKNKLTRDAAEKRYGEFLIDPDGFALRAGQAAQKAAGYKNWEDAAIGRSKNPEETRARIDKFKKESQLKALAVITVFSAVLLFASSNKKTYTLSGIKDSPTTNPYLEFKKVQELEELKKQKGL